MDDAALRRYSRHIVLPEIDEEGQQRLLNSHALIIGLGGLGSPAAIYLASSGVGHLTLCDYDVVELSNLQRQIVHTTERIGQKKVDSAQAALLALNPTIRIDTVAHALDERSLYAHIERADVVIDASDNFPTRFAINSACVHSGTPLVVGAVIRFTGQVTTIDPRMVHSPCYHCLYAGEEPNEESCAQQGIFAPLAGIVASIQAAEALKLLTNIGASLHGRLMTIDALTMAIRTLSFTQDPTCPTCSLTSLQAR